MSENNKIAIFQDKKIRMEWDIQQQDYWFSIVDIVGALTDSVNPTDYLKKMRKRDEILENYLGTNCPYVELENEDGKKRKVLAANTKQILRIIQSIPSKKC